MGDRSDHRDQRRIGDDVNDPTTFPLGVASCDPTTTSVLIWTASSAPGQSAWEVAADDRFVEVVASGSSEPGAAGTVTVEVDDLQPGRTYWYRFTAAGSVSPVGRTRTLPADGRLRLGVVCCARFGQARFDVYRAVAAADVDVVVHLGDYIYEDTKCDIDERAPVPDHDCVTLEDYRARHRQCREDPDLRLLHQRHPMVVVWDDHDISDNARRTGATNHDPDEHGAWTDRLGAALAAHHEFLPKRLAVPADLTSAWRSLDAGSLSRIVCTETRAVRDPPPGADGLGEEVRLDSPTRELLGPAQRAWLVDSVADPAPAWTLVLSGTVVTELTIPAPGGLGKVLPEKYVVEDDTAINSDQWDGFVADRNELVAAARRRGGNTVVLSGDIHSCWVLDGPFDESGAVAVELTCPPAATTPLGQLLPRGGGAALADGVTDRLDQVRWMNPDHRGYLEVDVTRERVAASYWWVDATDDGGPADVRLGKRWEVLRGALPPRLVDPLAAARGA